MQVSTGKYLNKVFLVSLIFISSIITTNRNNIAIAPAYTIIKIKAIKSTSNKNKRNDAVIKVEVKDNTEWTGFFTLITKIEDEMQRKLKK